jgi:hypothetical protein
MHFLWMASFPRRRSKKETLGLLTFDLDDSLYPIEPVMDEANAAFCRAMNRLGFSGDGNILPNGIADLPANPPGVAPGRVHSVHSHRSPTAGNPEGDGARYLPPEAPESGGRLGDADF